MAAFPPSAGRITHIFGPDLRTLRDPRSALDAARLLADHLSLSRVARRRHGDLLRWQKNGISLWKYGFTCFSRTRSRWECLAGEERKEERGRIGRSSSNCSHSFSPFYHEKKDNVVSQKMEYDTECAFRAYFEPQRTSAAPPTPPGRGGICPWKSADVLSHLSTAKAASSGIS